MVSNRYNGKHLELSEQRRQETVAMDASARTRVRVCADECLCHEKIFLLYKLTVTALLLGHCCEKQNKFSGSHSF